MLHVHTHTHIHSWHADLWHTGMHKHAQMCNSQFSLLKQKVCVYVRVYVCACVCVFVCVSLCVCVCVCVCSGIIAVLLSTLPPVTVKVGYISAASLALSTVRWFGFSEGHHQIGDELAYLQTYVTKSQFGLNEQLTAEQCYKSVTKVYCNLSTFTVLS